MYTSLLSHPPRTHNRALCIVLLQGPRRALFLMSEIPLYCSTSAEYKASGQLGQDEPAYEA